MQFIELLKDKLEKVKFKIFAPAIVVYRQFGCSKSEFVFCSLLPACVVFAQEPIDKNGYYKTVYVNNKRIKPWHIIPRNALIEVRQKPKIATFFATIGGVILSAVFGAEAVALGAFSIATMTIVGIATTTLVVGGLAIGANAVLGGQKTGGGTSSPPTYSSNDSPSLTGAKNEMLERQVPIIIGRTYQVFNYAQYATPLVKSGFGGNRYQTYFIPTYKNVNFYDFSLGKILINNFRTSAYNLREAHGVQSFIGFDNAQTEALNNKELSFDNSQSQFYSAIAYYNYEHTSATSIALNIYQKYKFYYADYNNFSDKTFKVNMYYLDIDNNQITLEFNLTIRKADIIPAEDDTFVFEKNFEITLPSMLEYLRTTTEPTTSTRNNVYEDNLLCELNEEYIDINNTIINPEAFNPQSIDSFSGDKVEVLTQSPTKTRYGDIHFSFPSGLYRLTNDGSRRATTIKADITWKRVGETQWHNIDDEGISQIYTRNIDGEIEELSKRITRSGNIFTFKSPDNLGDANNKFFECVGFRFAKAGEYIFNIKPVTFNRDNYFIGNICVSEVVWRLDESVNVVNPSILPSVSQVACTFNATTQLEGDVDELGCISFAKILNLKTGDIEESRNPVDIIYYLLTDVNSNPRPMNPSQIDMPSFLKARLWCESHNCKTDGIINEEIKYSAVLEEICSNNQLYLIPNKWGKVVLRVDTNEDNRPIKTIFTAENSWDLNITRTRGKLNRKLAMRCSYIDEETWSEQEITGYWYDNKCNWTPESNKDDLYYQPEKTDLNYVRNSEAVKRKIAYELEIANAKNTLAEFHIAREVLDLEVLDRVLVADYTRINDGVTGTIDELIIENEYIVGVKVSQPFVVKQGMTISIRSIDISGKGENVNTYYMKQNDKASTNILFETPILKSESIIRTAGFYTIDGQEFYHGGDLYVAGSAEILSMVVKSIEEIDGDSFTSKITCRSY